MLCRRIYCAQLAAILFLSHLTLQARSQSTELEQHLQDQYKDKTLVLRGFHEGKLLIYDSAGTLTSGARPGDWTSDGFVMIADIRVVNDRLTIRAKRVRVAAGRQEGFRFLADRRPDRKKKGPFLEMSIGLGLPNASLEQADAAMSKIFLTRQDALEELVPEYWKPCVSGGLRGNNAACHFPEEFRAIPGVASLGGSTPAPTLSGTSVDANTPVFRVGKGISPPKQTFAPEPEFSEAARQANFQGMVTLKIVVDSSGFPTNIRIFAPLGCGLDEKAVSAVRKWKFKPAEKDGQPVAVEIDAMIDFHMF